MAVTGVTSSSLQSAGIERSYRRLEQGLGADLPIGPQAGPALPATEGRPPGGVQQPDFLDIVKGFVGDVNDLQMRSGRAIDAFVAGEVTDVHQVMVAVQEAGLALDLLLEVRNRTVEAFQEVMRMQV